MRIRKSAIVYAALAVAFAALALTLFARSPSGGGIGAMLDARMSGTELSEADSGKTVRYRTGDRFTLILDPQKHPENALSCAPPSSGIVKEIEAKKVAPPLFARAFVAVKAGSCAMTDTGFIVTIVVE
jgi:hypothetical protein